MTESTVQCPKITDNPNVQWAGDHWTWIVIAIMALWIAKRGVK